MFYKGIVQFTKSISQKNKSLEEAITSLSKHNPEVKFSFMWNDWKWNELEYTVKMYDKTKDIKWDHGYTCEYLTTSNLSQYSSSFSNTKETLYKSLSSYMKKVWFTERRWVTSHIKNFLWVEVDFWDNLF